MRLPRPKSLTTILAVNHVPLVLFVVVVTAGTIGMLESLTARTWLLADKLDAGTLQTADIEALGARIRWMWIVTLTGMYGVLAAALSVAYWCHNGIATRLMALSEYVSRKLSGGSVEGVLNERQFGLGQLESRVLVVADELAERNLQMEDELARQRYDAQVQHAMELVDSEEAIFEVAGIALSRALPGIKGQFLLADSSNAHLRPVAAASNLKEGCPVQFPRACAAVRQGRTLRFESSQSIDSCPMLRHHALYPCAAACTPVSVLGTTVGVLHAVGEDGELPSDLTIRYLRATSAHMGGRLGMLRTLASSQLAAETDSLTGLFNRRSFEDRAAGVVASHGPGLVAMADLDHFKRLNDTHGHEAGDRALRAFAGVLRRNLRPTDVVGRIGGEEFALVIADCDIRQGLETLERIRSALSQVVGDGKVPAFTVSAGVCEFAGGPNEDLAELLQLADQALYQAKEGGRNKIVLWGSGPIAVPDAG